MIKMKISNVVGINAYVLLLGFRYLLMQINNTKRQLKY